MQAGNAASVGTAIEGADQRPPGDVLRPLCRVHLLAQRLRQSGDSWASMKSSPFTPPSRQHFRVQLRCPKVCADVSYRSGAARSQQAAHRMPQRRTEASVCCAQKPTAPSHKALTQNRCCVGAQYQAVPVQPDMAQHRVEGQWGGAKNERTEPEGGSWRAGLRGRPREERQETSEEEHSHST